MTGMTKFLRNLENAGSQTKPGKTGHPKLDALATGLWVGQQSKDWIEKARTEYRKHTTWTVTVEESDVIFRAVQDWLLVNMPKKDQKNVNATTSTVYFDAAGDETKTNGRMNPFEDYEIGPSAGHTETRVSLTLGKQLRQKMNVGGYSVIVHASSDADVNEERDRDRAAVGMRGASRVKGNGRIMFTCRSVAAQDAVVEMLANMVGGKNKRKPHLWIADGWGNWRSQDSPLRRLDTVILREGLKEDITGDLRKFLADERKYTDLGIPWHRGYLLHGPPGTGKTSFIKALAADMGLDLWYAPLGDLKEDSSLVDLIRSVKPRGILLLEDVDAYSAAKDRGDDEGDDKIPGGGISSTALLNALDGVVTPHGLITIMTTNHIEKLDPALIRNGRADRVVELGKPSMTEISNLWTMFFPDEKNMIAKDSDVFPGVSQAEVSEIFKSNWENPTAARTALDGLLAGNVVHIEG